MPSKPIEWDDAKNSILLNQRSVCFEDVLGAIEDGRVLGDEPHPTQTDYPRQRVLIVEIGGYVCVVPYVENETAVFFKTIYRSRVYTKKYLSRI